MDRETFEDKAKKKVTRHRKENRKEQRPVNPEVLIAEMRKTVMRNNPGLSAPEIDRLVAKMAEKAMRPHKGKALAENSKTAQDLLRESRKKAASNMAKYRR